MPRFGNPARSSVLLSDGQYDLTKQFKSYVGGFTYDKYDSIVLWGNLCIPAPNVADSYDSHSGLFLVGTDGSNSANKHGLYSPTTISTQIDETTEFCGSKCSFRFTGLTFPLSSPSAGRAHFSGHYFVVPDHDELTFNNSGTDQPFSISLWFQSLDPNAGGANASSQPISYLINKPYEYGLSVTGERKLRFSMSDGSGTNSIFVESAADPMEDATFDSSGALQGGLNHIVITYDGSETSAGMKIYLNGVNITQTAGSTGTYTGMTNGSGNLFFGNGAGIPGTSLPLSSTTTGIASLTEPSIWTAELEEEDIKAVYNASLTCAAKTNVGESGYTNLPPRVTLRSFDNHPLSYPSVFRTGDRDRKGNFNVSFNDTSTLIFGSLIEDEFKDIRPDEISSERIDRSKWSFTEGMEIRRETLAGYNGASFQDGVLVFAGAGNLVLDRFIRTKQKVRNATIKLELVQGPHNQSIGEHFLMRGLNLEKGITEEKLKVQISTHGNAFGVWTDVKTFTPSELSLFYGPAGTRIDLDTRYRQQAGPGFSTSDDEPGALPYEEFKVFRKKIVIPFSEIDDPGEAYYVRIVQDYYESSDKSVWAIGKIEIESMNQDIRYPLLVDHDTTAGKKVAESFIATPHTRSDITAVGRTVSGISDTMLKFTPSEDISPFNETFAVESLDPTVSFFKVGTDPKFLPGFTSRLADKTKFTLDISTYNSDYFGYISGSAGQPPFPLGGSTEMPLMGYYNHSLRKWEPIAKGYFWKCSDLFDHPFDSQNSVMHAVTSSAVGFGSFGHVAIEQGSSIARLPESPSILDRYSRHITNFGFPFDGRYHASGSQVITARDVGITKPFLLEKIIFEFDGMFEYADAPGLYNANAVDSAFNLKVLSSSNSELYTGRFSRYTLDPHYKYYLPTFFLLRQKKGYVNGFKIKNVFDQAPSRNTYGLRTGSFFGVSNIGGTPIDFPGTYEVNIPGYYDINGDGSKDYYVNTTRDLAAYGQLGLLVSGSQGTARDGGFIDINQMLTNGMEREALVKISPSNDCSITGSFRLGFSPQVTQQYDSATSTSVVLAMPSLSPSVFTTGSLHLDNKAPREIEASRRLANNYPGTQDPKRDPSTGENLEITVLNLFDTTRGPVAATSVEKASRERPAKLGSDSVTLPAPYVLMPGDELVIGLQYPLAEDAVRLTTVNGKNKFQDKMKMHGPAKVHFYGSLISNASEFHEYNNQNLTSNAVHEVIGSEKILDQFQTATRSELSGSYIDDWTTGTGYWQLSSVGPAYPWLDAQYVPTIHRVGLPIFSKAGVNTSAWMNNESNFSSGLWPRTRAVGGLLDSARARTLTRRLKECGRPTRFVQHKDSLRRYVDSLHYQETFMKASSYGTMQSYLDTHQTYTVSNEVHYRYIPDLGSAVREWLDVVGGLSGSQVIVPSDQGEDVVHRTHPEGTYGQWRPGPNDSVAEGSYYNKKRHNRAAPKYYFNYKHFGYAFDMLEQARDGRTVVPGTLSPLVGDTRDMTTDGRRYRITFSSQENLGPHLPDHFERAKNGSVSTLALEPDDPSNRIAAPVHAQFVTTSSNPGQSVVKFVKVLADKFSTLGIADPTRANPIFNTSAYMTSSYPYIEDGRNPYYNKA